jgi:hypothetical protein
MNAAVAGDCPANETPDPEHPEVKVKAYYPLRMVEARLTAPSGSPPALPTGYFYHGFQTLSDLSTYPRAAGLMVEPPPDVATTDTDWENVAVITAWTLWKNMQDAACGVCRFAARYLLNGINCADERTTTK